MKLCGVTFYRKGETVTHTCHRVAGHLGPHREDANLARSYSRRPQKPGDAA